MSALQSLRNARAIVRWMLVCFAVSIGLAIASPIVNPQALQLICTATGSAKWVPTDDGSGGAGQRLSHTLNCVMCLPAVAPPSVGVKLTLAVELGDVLHEIRLAIATWRLADPTSARDPPSVA